MNIYSYEIRSQIKSFVIWTLSILLVYTVFMTGMFNVFMESRETIEKAYSGLPPAFAAAFGIYIDRLFTYGGFYSFLYNYIALIGAIMAAAFSASAFSREKRSKCVDFLLTKPLGRGKIFMAKLLSSLTLLAVANILFVAAASVGYTASGQDPEGLGRLVWASCALFFTQLVFMAFGVLFAVYARKVRSVSGIATAFGFAGFILSALYSLLEEEAVHFIAPLKYFEPISVFTTGGFEVRYAVTAFAVTAVCLCLSYVKYIRYDVPAL